LILDDLVQAGMQQALIVGGLGLLLTTMVLWGLYHFMRSSQRLAAEIATTNSMKVSLELMNRELIHRVGNLLAIAQGIIRLSYNTSLSTVEFRDSILARLHAFHQSVGLINREDWTGVWLHELLQTELAPVADRINVSGRDALLKPKAAQSLSLLFYELMTNSSKHGALSKHEGTVTAEWEIKDSDSGRLFCFRWQEHGHEIIKPPTRQGFGTKLLTRLVPGDLSGQATLSFESGRFKYELEAPVEHVVEQETNASVIVKAVFPLRVTPGNFNADKLRA
jgi:two-component sensor histidine kinase